jgi:hypothetical protein
VIRECSAGAVVSPDEDVTSRSSRSPPAERGNKAALQFLCNRVAKLQFQVDNELQPFLAYIGSFSIRINRRVFCWESEMISRRRFVQSSLIAPAAALLSGCKSIRKFFRPEMSRGAIDIHAHIFNGRDVPVVGFLEQVVLRDPHRSDPPDFLTGGLLKLLKFVLLSGTPTAEEELRRLDAEPTALRAPRDMAAEDEGNVAAAIARFEAELAPNRWIHLHPIRGRESPRPALQRNRVGPRAGGAYRP